MTLDPKDFILPSHLVDANRFAEVIGTVVDTARLNPVSAVTLAVDTGSALRNIFTPSAALLASAIVPKDYLSSVAASLATLRPQMEALAAIRLTEPFAGTINTLATVGSIGIGVQNLYDTSPLPASIKLPELSFGAAAFKLGMADSLRISSSVAAPYLASSSAIFQLETSFSKAFADQTLQVSKLKAGITLQSHMATLQSSVLNMSGALRNTWDLIRNDTARLSVTFAPILRAPAVELYSAVQTTAAISLPPCEAPARDNEIETILDDAVDAFESRLAGVHQGLVPTYRGGLEALENSGTDWQRHAMVSFRELATHVLKLLAPDGEVVKRARAGDLHEGRPTRRARLNYIFADVAGLEIAKFYEADMRAAIELFDMLSGGTHKLEQTASAEQVYYLRGRVVGLLSSMLEARGF